VKPIPTTATVGANQNLCGTLTSTYLGGNTQQLVLATSQTSGPELLFQRTNSGISTATASAVGTYVYKWTISNATCIPSTARLQLIIMLPNIFTKSSVNVNYNNGSITIITQPLSPMFSIDTELLIKE
jgi:hypothetical protein